MGTTTEQVGESLSSQRDLGGRRLARPLLKRVKDVDGFLEPCQVEDAMFHASVNANLKDSRTHRWHRLPVGGQQSLLHPTELVSSSSTRALRKRSEGFE